MEVESTAYAKRVEATGAVDVVYEADEPETEAGDTAPYHQVLGKPRPEQDDPRYDAVMERILGRPYGSREDYALMKRKTGLATDDEMAAHIGAESQAYVLLLQLDVASFLDMNNEGTFYILLHRDDLKARRFDNAITIYQQT